MESMTAHPLREFLRKEGLTQAEFAKRVGIKQPTISDVLRGRHRFSPQTALRIERATRKQITVGQLLFAAKPTKRKKAGAEVAR